MTSLLDEQPANVSNLREKILEHVRSGIITGRTEPGTVFSVPSLAADLGVSTTPVREALLELARDGLVSPLRNRGFRVEGMSVAALGNLFALRELLETYALECVARNRPDDTTELTQRADAVAKAVKAHDVPAYIATDRAFHHALVERAENPMLTKLVFRLRDDMRLYGIDSAEGRKRQIASVTEHYEMIKIAASGEAARAAALMTKHIMSWKPLFTKTLAPANK
jgi:DNA-binding GntR family transcriptional regulator